MHLQNWDLCYRRLCQRLSCLATLKNTSTFFFPNFGFFWKMPQDFSTFSVLLWAHVNSSFITLYIWIYSETNPCPADYYAFKLQLFEIFLLKVVFVRIINSFSFMTSVNVNWATVNILLLKCWLRVMRLLQVLPLSSLTLLMIRSVTSEASLTPSQSHPLPSIYVTTFNHTQTDTQRLLLHCGCCVAETSWVWALFHVEWNDFKVAS